MAEGEEGDYDSRIQIVEDGVEYDDEGVGENSWRRWG